MIPGTVSKLSEEVVALTTVLVQRTDIIRVSSTASTTTFTTITPPKQGGFSSVLFLFNDSGAAITALTTGNITGTASQTIANQRMSILVFSKSDGKWVSALSQ